LFACLLLHLSTIALGQSGWTTQSPIGHNQGTLPCQDIWDLPIQITNNLNNTFGAKLAVTDNGVHLVYVAGSMFYKRSTDLGETWSDEFIVVPVDSLNGQIFIRPFVADGENLFFVWQNLLSSAIKLRRSTDSGSSWEKPKVVVAQHPLRNYGSPVISARGESVYVALNGVHLGNWQVFFTRSTDGGDTWSPVELITTGYGHMVYDIYSTGGEVLLVMDWSSTNFGYEIAHMVSTDGGLSWSSEYQLSTVDSLQSWEGHLAGDNEGNVFVCWLDAKYGSTGYGGKILSRKSTDNGSSWQDEVSVNVVPSAVYASVSGGQSGLHVVWGDERAGTFNGRIYYSSSSNGDSAWCEEVLLSDSDDFSITPALAATSSFVHSVWSNNSLSPTQMMHTRAPVPPTSVSQDGVGGHENHQARLACYPNPFNESVVISFTLQTSSHVRLAVHNLLGEELIVLKNGIEAAGPKSFTFSGKRLASGVYYVIVETGVSKEAIPIVLLR